ncbi:MAG TPA: type II toxin-antitoxin system RatA family toxin [Caulobacteraceae bacterium]|nr:type II toxin-antitoxin system RatA family toxin [Caulobacteraceae bacterium]
MRQQLRRVLPYAPAQLFALVGDVERYPEFVPWVSRLTVANRRRCDGAELLDAEAEVGFAIVRERFATRVRLDREALTIEADLLSGPFRRLQNRWRFSPHPIGVELDFSIDFEFRSRLLKALLAANMGRAVARLILCFEKRAASLYGPSATAP